jgi:phage repressor protein C with HTH and peptisase S24 domain
MEVLRSGVRVRVTVRGPSMAPTLVTGDAVIVEAADAAQLVPGELALFRLGELIYAHRFAGRSRNEAGEILLHFVADAKPEPDPPVPSSALIGRIVAIEHAVQSGLLDLISTIPLLDDAHDLLRRGLSSLWNQL